MNIIEGGLPEGKRWRALVMLSPGQAPGAAVRLADDLVRAHDGEIVLAIILHHREEDALVKARDTLSEAAHFCDDSRAIYTLILESPRPSRTVRRLADLADIDLIVLRHDDPIAYRPERLPNTVLVMYDVSDELQKLPPPSHDDDEPTFERILIPSSAGPNTAQAMRLLLPLAQRSQITAAYIARNSDLANQDALGRSQLRRLLSFVDAENRIQSKIVPADNVIEGILDEGTTNADLVVIGATRLSTLDRAVFGNVVEGVLGRRERPVAVVYENSSRVDNALRALAWRVGNIVPRIPLQERTQIYARVRRSARPDIDFFILIGLSTLIASLGLLLNSPAVVIGAMLVAPLMSPIVGSGMAIVLGDVRFLRVSLETIIRGVVLAIVLAALMGLLRLDQSLTNEVLARTQPSLLDLGIALFSGMAGAYAISRSDAAAALPGVAISAALVPPLASVGIAFVTGFERESLGALLLFTTNLIAIASASAFVFVVLGFRPSPGRKQRVAVQQRSARLAALLLVVVTALLVISTLPLARETALQTQITDITRQGVAEVTSAEMVDLKVDGEVRDGPLQLSITAQSTRPVPHDRVVALQSFISSELNREIGLTMRIILVTELDPRLPPETAVDPAP